MKHPHCIALFLSIFCSTLAFGQSDHWSMLQGQSAFAKKDYKSAEKAFASIKNNAQAAYNAGLAMMQQGNLDAAAAGFSKAAGLYKTPSGQSDAWFNAGNALLAMGSYSDAVQAYKKALRCAPNRADAKKNLQIALKNIPPPPVTTPPPPPPPPPPPKREYLDQGRRSQEPVPAPLSPDAARRLLESAVAPQEEESARRYRHLSPSNRPTRSKKAW